MTTSDIELVNTKKAAKMLDSTEGTLRYWRCAQKGPKWVRIGGHVKYDVADLLEYIDAGRRVPSVRASVEASLGAL